MLKIDVQIDQTDVIDAHLNETQIIFFLSLLAIMHQPEILVFLHSIVLLPRLFGVDAINKATIYFSYIRLDRYMANQYNLFFFLFPPRQMARRVAGARHHPTCDTTTEAPTSKLETHSTREKPK